MIIERLLTLIAPHNCLLCGAEGSLLCSWCLPDACQALPARCYPCHQQAPDSATCRSCRARSPLNHVWVRTDYDGVAKGLINALKFERAGAAAQPIGRLMTEALPFLPTSTIVAHVPTATGRRRQRGYDQSELLAREISRSSGLQYLSLLGRSGQTRQVGSKRDQRLKQLQTVFYPRHEFSIRGTNILLVDDILTTGATLESAAWVLKRAAAKQINGLVFASAAVRSGVF